ncbi:MAG: hypothetical protein F6J90_20720 [Moorea sp. SIOASIH]|uniref:hypothetical protein n=1 Tax=Moorena sp. SIOASIH TaxID=2607817 RepID=UPI0013B730CD|nr:hypothetical protein [Moorena sp. SIOASIH]NEO38623.1 hypothetical protein [Moorena sp. SIOASIH]
MLSAVSHQLCSLFPVPCSLFPVPYSLLPTPYSLLPTPFSLFSIMINKPQKYQYHAGLVSSLGNF